MLTQVLAGGVTINDRLPQIVQDNLPFGSIGDSSTGNCNSRAGFEHLSQMNAACTQAKYIAMDLLAASITPFAKRMLTFTERTGRRYGPASRRSGSRGNHSRSCRSDRV